MEIELEIEMEIEMEIGGLYFYIFQLYFSCISININ